MRLFSSEFEKKFHEPVELGIETLGGDLLGYFTTPELSERTRLGMRSPVCALAELGAFRTTLRRARFRIAVRFEYRPARALHSGMTQ